MQTEHQEKNMHILKILSSKYFVFQPILSKLPNYKDMTNPAVRQKDVEQWNTIHEDIRNMLRACANKLVMSGQLPQGSNMKYEISGMITI